MKKTITILLIFILLFTSMPFNRVWAVDSDMLNNLEQGKPIQRGEDKESVNTSDAGFSLTGTLLAYVVAVVPLSIQTLLSLASTEDMIDQFRIFTIEDMLLGRFELFNVDFLTVVSIPETENVPSSTNVLIKENVAKWFYAMRSFAIVALLAVLIYIGILMATSTIASDKAKYKNMLIHWFVSFAILMLLPYIMAIAMNICEVCVGIIRTIAETILNEQVDNTQIQQEKGLNFELTLLYGKADTNGNGFDGIFSKIALANSWQCFYLVCVYCVLVYYQIKFFFLYLKRMFTVGFLIVISPLITITYSIDKAGDNQAQAYNTWIKEFLVNIFIQPLHALLFLIFMYSIYGIMEKAPLLAIVFLAALSRGEKIVRSLFKMERTSTFAGLRKGKGK